VPLETRYRGTSVERSARARALMSDAEVRTVAQLINDVVDLPFYDEDEEQEIFEFSVLRVVETLAAALPNEMIYHVHSEKAMAPAHAKAFEARLRQWLYARCDAPFLDEGDERKVVRCVLALLMRSMRAPRSAVGDLDSAEKNRLVFEVFVKGALEVFYEDHKKREWIERVEHYGANLPFSIVPTFCLAMMCESLLARASEHVTPVLMDTYYEFLVEAEHAESESESLRRRRAEDDEPAASSSRRSMSNAKLGPFTTLLRHNLCRAFIRDHVEVSDGVLRVLSYIPRDDAERYALLFVDSFLDAIDASKLDALMTTVASDDRVRRDLITGTLDRHPGCEHAAAMARRASLMEDDPPATNAESASSSSTE